MENNPDAFSGMERRSHKRYRVKDDALAFFGQDIGTILDISRGGISIHYTVFDKPPPLCHTLDIFLANAHLYIPNLSVSLVDEVQTLPHSIFSSLRVNRISMKFGVLAKEQQVRLEDFITNFTVAAV